MTYQFPNSTNGYDTTQDDKELHNRFKHGPSKKDRFGVDDCRNARERWLLEFLIPIFSPVKPTTCTSKLLRAIFGAYIGVRECGWGIILADVHYREWLKIGTKRGCPLTAFANYSMYDILTKRERHEWARH